MIAALAALAAACGRVGYDHDPATVASDAIAAGYGHTCVLFGGTLACAGENAHGQLGDDGLLERDAVAPVESTLELSALSLGYSSTAVLDVDGSVWTVGANDRRQLGRTPTPLATLGRVLLPGRAVRLSHRFEHGCAILEDASLHCWGSNFEGELGQDDPVDSADREAPVRVPLDDVIDVSAGQGHTCAITRDGSLHCWGRNTEGELGLGDGSPVQVRRPTFVSGGWRSVACGQSHTCAIDAAGDVHCWGSDSDADGHAGPLGALGDGSSRAPRRVEGASGFLSISTDTFHVCGIRTDGSLWCWGRNHEGQLGLGDPSIVADTPRHIGDDSDWSEVAVGRFHTCARKRDGRTLCTGDNPHGELGVGDRDDRAGWTAMLLEE